MRGLLARGLLVALLALATGCGGQGSGAPGDIAAGGAPVVGATTTEDPNALYADFPECEPLPAPTPHESVPGAVELDDAWIESVSRTGVLTTITGLVEATPVDLRDDFADRDDVEVIYVEDEGYETEILLDDGEHRTYLKATIRCRTGSVVAQIVAPAGGDELLPVPGQQG